MTMIDRAGQPEVVASALDQLSNAIM